MIHKQADKQPGEGKTQLSKQVAYRGGLAASNRVLFSQGTKVQGMTSGLDKLKLRAGS